MLSIKTIRYLGIANVIIALDEGFMRACEECMSFIQPVANSHYMPLTRNSGATATRVNACLFSRVGFGIVIYAGLNYSSINRLQFSRLDLLRLMLIGNAIKLSSLSEH